MRTFHIKCAVLLLFVFCALYLVALGVRPLMQPDEFRYAEISREMVANSSYIIPRFNGIRYYEKPALGYYCIASCFKLFGCNAFALRLPSALGVLGSVVILYLLMLKFGDDEYMPFVSCAVFLLMGLVWGIGTFGVLDSLFSCFVTLTIGVFYFAREATILWKRIVLLLLAGVFAGLAFWTKGFLAFALPVIVIVPFLIWEKEW